MQRDYKYKNTVSKTGIYTLHINAELNKQISEYCKMKNLNKAITLKRATPVAGLFGTLKSGAVIENVSFENVTLNLKIPMPADYGVGLLAGEAEDGVTVSGCRFTDCAITYAKFPGAADATVQYSAETAWAGILGKTVGTPAFDGTVTVTFRASGDMHILWDLFKWGDFVEIVEPKKLKDEYIDILQTCINKQKSK